MSPSKMKERAFRPLSIDSTPPLPTRWLPVTAIGLLAFATAACSDPTSPNTTPGTLNSEVARVEVGPSGLSLFPGESFVLELYAEDGNRREIQPVGQYAAHWTSSDASVAMVDSEGNVHAYQPGTVTVSARVGGISAATTVVIEQEQFYLIMDQETVEGPAGDDVPEAIEVKVVDMFGLPRPGAEVVFQPEAGGYASPASITTDEFGSAFTTWRLAPESGIQTLEVAVARGGGGDSYSSGWNWGWIRAWLRARASVGDPAQINLTPPSAVIEAGGAAWFAAKVRDGNGNVINDAEIDWSSTRAEVAEVQQDGAVTGVSAGTSKIMARSGDAEGEASISVFENSTSQSLVVVSGSGQSVPVGSQASSALVAAVRSSDGSVVAGANVAWAVIEGSASLDVLQTVTGSDGRTSNRVTAGGETGPIRVRASIQGGSTTTFSLSAIGGAVAEVRVFPQTLALDPGESRRFDAELRDAFDNLISGGSVQWSSSNTGVASVAADGTVTAIAGGTSTIQARAGGHVGSASLVVSGSQGPPPPPPGGGGSGSVGTVTDLAVVGTTQNSIRVRFTEVDNGSGEPARYAVRYAATPFPGWSGATQVASGTCRGLLHGTAVGSSRECTVEGLTPDRSYDVTVLPWTGTWGRATLGEIGPAATGFTGTGGGGGGGTPSGPLTVTPSSATLTALGATTQLRAMAESGNGTAANSVSGMSEIQANWVSLTPQVATVNSSGQVTARAVGTALIVASAVCCSADTATIQVVQQPATMEINPPSATLGVGSTQQLSAVVEDALGSPVPVGAVSWSSSDPSVLSVSSGGTIEGISAGTAFVTARSGGLSAEASVQVTGGGGPPPPPPPNPNGPHPNEPAGYTLIVDPPLDRIQNAGGVSFHGHEHLSIVQGPSPVPGRSAFLRNTWPGWLEAGETAGVVLTEEHDGYDEIYLSGWVRWPENYYANAADNKMFILWGGGRTQVYISLRGSRDGPLKLFLSNFQGGNIEPNPGAPEFVRGQWHHVEMVAEHNRGVVHVWLDGQLAVDGDDAVFAGSSWDEKFEWNPIFGGTGAGPGRDHEMDLAEFYVSGKR